MGMAMRMKPIKTDPKVFKFLKENAEAVNKMTPIQIYKMCRRQAKSWARQDMD
jgi:hypothetical protein